MAIRQGNAAVRAQQDGVYRGAYCQDQSVTPCAMRLCCWCWQHGESGHLQHELGVTLSGCCDSVSAAGVRLGQSCFFESMQQRMCSHQGVTLISMCN
jgi:hypothetical protein